MTCLYIHRRIACALNANKMQRTSTVHFFPSLCCDWDNDTEVDQVNTFVPLLPLKGRVKPSVVLHKGSLGNPVDVPPDDSKEGRKDSPTIGFRQFSKL